MGTEGSTDGNKAPENICYPTKFSKCEETAISKRRKAAGFVGDKRLLTKPVGLAISGGGIRSATFGLGVVQGLARAGVLRRIDYLSTVSGGGFIGSFLGRLFLRQWIQVPKAGDAQPAEGRVERHALSGDTVAERVEEVLRDSSRKPIDWLRENGRYLSPNGAGDLLLAFSAVLRNWVAIHIVLATFVLTILLLLQGLRLILPRAGRSAWFWPFRPGEGPIWWSELAILPLVALVFFAIPLGWAYWLGQRGRKPGDGPWPKLVWAGTRVLLVTFLWGVPGLFGMRSLYHDEVLAVLTTVTVMYEIALVYVVIAGMRAEWLALGGENPSSAVDKIRNNKLTQWLRTTLSLTGLAFLIVLVDSLGQTLYAALQSHAFDISSTLSDVKTRVALGVLAGVLLLGRKLATLLAERSGQSRLNVPSDVLATIAAAVLILAVLVTLSVISHALTANFGSPEGMPPGELTSSSPSGTRVQVSAEGPVSFVVAVQAHRPRETGPAKAPGSSSLGLLWWWSLGCGVLFTVIFGRLIPFLNQSSHQVLDAARLTRAYMGASNPSRWSGKHSWITEPLPGDGIGFEEYKPHEQGGPLHLINVTVNETLSGRSQVEQRDRKGLGMAVGPIGVSVGAKHHATWKWDEKKANKTNVKKSGNGGAEESNGSVGDGGESKGSPAGKKNANGPEKRDRKESIGTLEPLSTAAVQEGTFKVFPAGKTITPEVLDVGTWISISGAAVSTGMGARTSLGLSLLCGFFNLRLGYWWNSGVEPGWREDFPASPRIGGKIKAFLDRVLPVQMHLLDEFLARFHGPARRLWYLSDGGHFENTGVYELIRRRLPLILVCDNGADPEYRFSDLAGLVRKARLDFGTEIEFLDEPALASEDLDAKLFGSLDQLRLPGNSKDATKPRRAERHAAVARVLYPDSKRGAMIVLKPTVTGDEPADVLEYAARSGAFPQEPTSDQFFDEAQWESYRKLGDVTVARLATKIFERFDSQGGEFFVQPGGGVSS